MGGSGRGVICEESGAGIRSVERFFRPVTRFLL